MAPTWEEQASVWLTYEYTAHCHLLQVEDVANAMSPLVLNKQLPLQVRLLTDAGGFWQYMHADSARLKQVLTNVRREPSSANCPL